MPPRDHGGAVPSSVAGGSGPRGDRLSAFRPVRASGGHPLAGEAPESAGQLAVGQPTQCIYIGLWRGMLRPPSNPPLSRRCRSSGRTGASPRTPEPVCAHRAAAHRVVTRVPRANRAACGVAEALRLPEVEEPVQEAVSGLGSPLRSASGTTRWSKTRPTAASTRPRADSLPPSACRAGMIGACVLALAISLVIAAIVGFALLLVRRRPPPSA